MAELSHESQSVGAEDVRKEDNPLPFAVVVHGEDENLWIVSPLKLGLEENRPICYDSVAPKEKVPCLDHLSARRCRSHAIPDRTRNRCLRLSTSMLHLSSRMHRRLVLPMSQRTQRKAKVYLDIVLQEVFMVRLRTRRVMAI